MNKKFKISKELKNFITSKDTWIEIENHLEFIDDPSGKRFVNTSVTTTLSCKTSDLKIVHECYEWFNNIEKIATIGIYRGIFIKKILPYENGFYFIEFNIDKIDYQKQLWKDWFIIDE